MSGVNEQQVRDDLAARGHPKSYIDKVAPHKVHKGNRPTNTLLMKRISPKSLGSLIALYEQKKYLFKVLFYKFVRLINGALNWVKA